MPVGRTAYLLARLPADHALAANYRRILAWLFIAGCFGLAGGWAAAPLRPARWLAAVLCEYVSPMLGFALPGLGRSRTREWTVDGAHLAKRCQQFVIVALAAGPCRYRLGSAVCKRVLYGLVPRSSILAAAARVLLAPRAERVDLLTLATLDTAMRLWQWRTGRGAWGGVGHPSRRRIACSIEAPYRRSSACA